MSNQQDGVSHLNSSEMLNQPGVGGGKVSELQTSLGANSIQVEKKASSQLVDKTINVITARENKTPAGDSKDDSVTATVRIEEKS